MTQQGGGGTFLSRGMASPVQRMGRWKMHLRSLRFASLRFCLSHNF